MPYQNKNYLQQAQKTTLDIQLISVQIGSIYPEQADSLVKFCATFSDVPSYCRYSNQDVLAILLAAKAHAIDPYQSFKYFYCVQGRIGMYAETMAMLIRLKGHSIQKDSKSDDTICILHGKRADNGDTWTVSFSIEDAQRAGIYQNAWIKYPDVMCYNRALSKLFRQLFPDVSRNCGYNPDEVDEIVINSEKDVRKIDDHLPEKKILQTDYEKISLDQSIELNDLLNLCPLEYRDKLMERLKSFYPPITSLEDFPLEKYEATRQWAEEGAIKNQQQVLIAENEEEG
jgi:hypothetical protein